MAFLKQTLDLAHMSWIFKHRPIYCRRYVNVDALFNQCRSVNVRFRNNSGLLYLTDVCLKPGPLVDFTH